MSSQQEEEKGEEAATIQVDVATSTPPSTPPPPSSSKSRGHIKRSSLQLSPSWDRQNVSCRHLGDLDDDDMIPIAFFPLDDAPGSPKSPARRMATKKLSAMAISIPTLEGAADQKKEKKKKEEIESKSSGDENEDWSTASVTDSIFSYDGEIWSDVPMGPADAILGIASAFRKCEHPQKVNVCVGAYRDDQGRPYVLGTVRAAERKLLDEEEPKEYLPIEGDKVFIAEAMKFAYGKDMDIEEHVAAVQTLSGTGACAIGGRFLSLFWPNHPIYVPNPTWGNHIAIFKGCGLDCRKYRYYNREINGLDLQGMISDLQRARDGSIILLHACAHNPTGCDPTLDEWKKIIEVIHDKRHIAFFDSAYQGFASGSAEDDAQAFRYAVSQHVPILLAQSFAKNFGLYGERVGTLSVVCGDSTQKERILSELRLIIRPLYSSPPRHGSSIVKTVLGDPALKEQYYTECEGMAIRIKKMRKKLVTALQDAGSKHDWSHISSQIGMFAFTGLTEAMCKQLTEEYYIFLTTNGRISMAGLNDSNLQYVAEAIHAVSDGKSFSG